MQQQKIVLHKRNRGLGRGREEERGEKIVGRGRRKQGDHGRGREEEGGGGRACWEERRRREGEEKTEETEEREEVESWEEEAQYVHNDHYCVHSNVPKN